VINRFITSNREIVPFRDYLRYRCSRLVPQVRAHRLGANLGSLRTVLAATHCRTIQAAHALHATRAAALP